MSLDDKGMTLSHLSHKVITAASFINKVLHKCCSMRTLCDRCHNVTPLSSSDIHNSCGHKIPSGVTLYIYMSH